MNAALAATSDVRRPVVQPETNADRPKPLNAIRTVKDLRERLNLTPPGKVLRLLATAPLAPRCKVLLQALWCRAVWRSGEVHPSTSEADLLADTAMERRTLYRAMADLEKAGLVDRKRAYGRHRAQYALPWVCGQKTAETAGNRVIGAENRVSPIPAPDPPNRVTPHTRAKRVLPLTLPSRPSELQHPTPPPALPPTTERQDTAAGGASRLRSKADGKRQPLTAEQAEVKQLLAEDCGMWSNRAEEVAHSGITLEAVQIAWAEVQASDRTQKQHALYVRLTEDGEGYERQADEKREEARVTAERERRKPELDRNQVNVETAWNNLRDRDRTMADLLSAKGPFALAKVNGLREWCSHGIVGGRTPLNFALRGPRQRERALLRELRAGTAPRSAVSEIERAYWKIAPQQIADAVQAWYAVNEPQRLHAMPQVSG